jgi:flagellin
MEAAPDRSRGNYNLGRNMISLRTNVDSLNAQHNLNVDNQFQSKTIQQLTSGYRINSSGDDAAGLAVANGLRDSISELTQGVNNANDGVSQLQIIDGGLSNVSTILDRLKTLATQSASGTFTGSRATLNQEYQGLLSEITRQANNINLNSGGSFNNVLKVYVGGANNATNAGVSIDLSGSQSAVDATSLGLSTTNILGGGVGVSSNTQRLDAPGAAFLSGSNTQAFTFNVYSSGGATTVTATLSGGTNGLDESGVLSSLNAKLNPYGITAGVDGNGLLQFSGATAFTVSAAAASGGTGVTSGAGTAKNTSNYTVDGAAAYAAPATNETETLQFQTGSGSASVAIAAGDSLQTAISKINAQTSSLGVYAVLNAAGTGISFQGANSFSVSDAQAGTGTAAAAVFGTTSGYYSSTAPTTASSTNANAAITAINTAIQSLGLVQGRIGAGENKLQYAIGLAQSQIGNFSSAESAIRDADVAANAANLTKSQVLTQTAVAAMAQANAEPQAVLKLLQ